MTKSEMLDVITRARALLEKQYVPWLRHDWNGGHCQAGCLDVVLGREANDDDPIMLFLNQTAARLHPELAGRTAPRAFGTLSGKPFDDFDRFPSIYVNNHLGKQAILAVYDEAIQTLQVAVLCELEAARCAVPATSEREQKEGVLCFQSQD